MWASWRKPSAKTMTWSRSSDAKLNIYSMAIELHTAKCAGRCEGGSVVPKWESKWAEMWCKVGCGVGSKVDAKVSGLRSVLRSWLQSVCRVLHVGWCALQRGRGLNVSFESAGPQTVQLGLESGNRSDVGSGSELISGDSSNFSSELGSSIV